MTAFSDEWLKARDRRLRGVVGATFGVGAVLNLVSEVAGVEGSVWHVIRVMVGLAFLAALVVWLSAILWRRIPAGADLARRRAWVRRIRIVGLAGAAVALIGTLVNGDVILALAMVAVGGALAYELGVDARREREA